MWSSSSPWMHLLGICSPSCRAHCCSPSLHPPPRPLLGHQFSITSFHLCNSSLDQHNKHCYFLSLFFVCFPPVLSQGCLPLKPLEQSKNNSLGKKGCYCLYTKKFWARWSIASHVVPNATKACILVCTIQSADLKPQCCDLVGAMWLLLISLSHLSWGLRKREQ